MRGTHKHAVVSTLTAVAVAVSLPAQADDKAESEVFVDAAFSDRVVSGYAHASWQATDLSVVAGDKVEIEADGIACALTDVCFSPAGGGIPEASNFVSQELAGGALIGRIGDGTPFLVGESFEATATDSGLLYLAFNDSRSDDNAGGFEVEIEIEQD